MQLTATDRVAALFLEENAATLAAYGLSHFDRAERQLIRQGKKAIALWSLQQRQQSIPALPMPPAGPPKNMIAWQQRIWSTVPMSVPA